MNVQLTPEVTIGLFNIFAPIVREIIQRNRDAGGDDNLTDEEMTARFNAHVQEGLDLAAAWRARSQS